jgi:hypothetical protein
VRVRVAHRDYQLTDNRPEEWLLIEWPEGEKEPTKYWLSTLPERITFRRLVDFAKLRPPPRTVIGHPLALEARRAEAVGRFLCNFRS